MFKKFKTKELIFLALIGALMFVLAFFIGSGIILATGIPATGGLGHMLILSIIATFAILVIRKFWTATIVIAIFGILIIPTVIMGPPTVYKLIIALLLGIIYDSMIYLFKYKKAGLYVAVAVTAVCSELLIFLLFVFMGLPQAAKLKPLLVPFGAIYAVEALIGAWLGIKLYNKLKNRRVIRQITA